MFEFLNYKKELVFDTSLTIKKTDVDIEDFFNQFYVTDKFHRWFAQPPVVNIKFNKKHLDVGTRAKFIFRCLPFSYKMRCVEVKKNKYIRSEFYGRVSGGVRVKFIERDDEIYMDHLLTLCGNTFFIHIYYLIACSLPHKPYMYIHLQKLKKEAIKETRLRRKNDK